MSDLGKLGKAIIKGKNNILTLKFLITHIPSLIY